MNRLEKVKNAGFFFRGRMLAAGLLLCLLCCTNAIRAQERGFQISGTVKDAAGQALPYASVAIKGASAHTTSDETGRFSITAPSAESVVVISYIGHKTEEFIVGTRTWYDVVLTEQENVMNELVVVGFATQRRGNISGAVSTVDASVFENRPVTTAVQALQGAVPGLNIMSSGGGALDYKPDMNIRGTATIDSGSKGAPLILIDGMEADISILNPEDIESVSVLKDAASSSIYGSRAPFGVILVTTKKGQKGKTTLSYTNNLRWSDPIVMPKTMDSYTFALTMNEGYKNGGYGPFFDDEHLQRIVDFQAGKITATIPVDPYNPSNWLNGYYGGNDNVDYFDAIYRSWVFSQEHNLSLSGANDKIGYYASLNYMDQNGLMEFNQDKYDRFATNLKLNSDPTPWASFMLNMRFVKDNYGRPSAMTDGMFGDILRQGWPTIPLYDPNGNLFFAPSAPLMLRDRGRGNWETESFSQQLQMVLKPLKNWNITTEYNFRSTNRNVIWDWQALYNHDADGNPYVYYPDTHVHNDHARDNFHNVNVYSDYSLNFDSGHNVKLLAGFQSELYKVRKFGLERAGIMLPALPEVDLTTGIDPWGNPSTPTVFGSRDHWATAGFFGRVNYDYKERYILEVNARHDGTSRFRRENRWNTFLSASAGWNVANEEFWGDLGRYVGTLKPRISYGELGNQNTENYYPTYNTMNLGVNNGYWLIGGAQPNTASAPDLVSTTLTWERSNTWNVGMDFAAFRNRLTGSFDYFVRRTLDMVGPAPELPATLGTGVPKINNTDLKTTGWELSVSWNDRLKSGFGYGVSLSLWDSQTMITRYPNETGTLGAYREGQMVGEIWGLTTVGIAKTQQEMDAHLARLTNGGQDALGSQWEAGDIMFADLNNDGKIDMGANTIDDHGDLKIIGNTTPRYLFGLNLSADYKGVDFNAFFQGVMKRDYFADNFSFWGVTGDTWSVAPTTYHTDYFRSDPNHPLGQNLDSYFPRPNFGSTKNKQVQTKYLQNAAYMRLKNVQLGYTLPSEITRKFAVSKLRVYVSAENILTFTGMFEMFDPESVGGGWGAGVYPISKVVSFGVNLNF